MKALVWQGESEITYEELDDPAAEAGECVLDVEVAGICGSDVHGYRGHPGPRVPPLVLGHEVVGSVGGTRYTVYPLIGCGVCPRCQAGEENLCASWRLLGMHRPGVFSERVAVPQRSLVALPDGLEARRAVLAEPLACCLGALAPHDPGPETHMLVVGCGPIGLLTVYLGQRAGARVSAVDPVPDRRAQAEKLGAAGSEVRPASVDLVVDAAGFPSTWETAIDAVRSGGQIVVVGLGQAVGEIPMAVIVRRAIRLRGQFAYSRTDFARAVAILADADLNLDWLTDMPLAEGANAFANLVNRPEAYSKVLLWP